MHREVVERKGWCDDARFLRGLNFCLLLPGPEAHQLVTWLGWRMHGPAGGLAAGLLFVLPGALVMYVLTLAYLYYERAPAMEGALYGLRAVVVALVGQALFRMTKRVLRDTLRRVLAALACGALLFDVSYLWVVGFAALTGVMCLRPRPVPAGLEPVPDEPHVVRPPSILGTLRTLAIGLTLWWGPVAAAGALLGSDHRLVREGLYFGRLATLSFGGAYAVLAWMRQEAVQDLGWLTTREMADALSLAETTPGPLILVTQFVGSLAATRQPEPFSPLWAATLGALLTTWVTFAPSFLWIALGRDWVDRISEKSTAGRAMDGVSAAVVGVIATLALSLAFQAFVASDSHPGAIAPRVGALLIGLGAAAALVSGRVGLGWVLLAGVLAGPVAGAFDG
jgi:chromate transporter